jgi:predicted  nucleic acid-binding Zn-ribbon protein
MKKILVTAMLMLGMCVTPLFAQVSTVSCNISTNSPVQSLILGNGSLSGIIKNDSTSLKLTCSGLTSVDSLTASYLAATKDTLFQERQKITSLQNSVVSLQSSLTSARDTLTQVRSQLNSTISALSTAQSDIVKLNNSWSLTKDSLTTSKVQNVSLQSALKATQDSLVIAKNQVTSLQSQVTSLQTSLAAVKDTLTTVRAQLATSQASLVSTKDTLTTTRLTLTNTTVAYKDTVTTLRNVVQAYKDTVTTLRAPTVPTLQKIVISPKTVTVAVNSQQSFGTSGIYSDGTTKSLTATYVATGGTITVSGIFTAGSVSGTYTVIASSSGFVDTATVTVPAVVVGGFTPNKPATWTNFTQLDFSQVAPGQTSVDAPIVGAELGWNTIYNSNFVKSSDPTAPQSPSSVWVGTWPAGSYGGGVIGQGGGHGIGNVFTTKPNGTNRIYASTRVYFDMDANQWHPISNKFINIETNNGLILVQLNEGGHWRHAEFLSATTGSFWVDPGNGTAGQVSNIAVPTRKWVHLEVLIDIPNRIFKVWQDGVLTTDAKVTFTGVSKIYGIGWNAFRGGGGETISKPFAWRYDHFYVAW